jgi:hypothetical protein
MHGAVIGIRYESNRWLALMGLSLITLLLVLKHFPLLCTVVVRIYRRKKKRNILLMSIHAYMWFHSTHQTTQAFEYQKQTSLGF